MYIDQKLEFWKEQSLADANGDTAVFGDQIDLGTVESARRVFNGEVLYLNMFVKTASTNNASARIKLKSGTSVALAGSIVHLDTGVLAHTVLTKGAYFSFPIGHSAAAPKRYLGLEVTTGGAAQAALKMDAFISCQPYGHEHVLSNTSGG